MKETNMLATQKQTAETTLRLFQNNSKQEGSSSFFRITDNIGSRSPVVKTRKLLPKEQYACDMATD
tara:strand:+ start:1448 stop:1645 length:198 start_codon:yes stop_codon:yes gene_type:complete